MTDVYRIGVSLAMTSNGGQVLGALSRQLLGVHANTKELTKEFSRLKLAIGGALAIAGGVALIGVFKGPLEEAKKYQTELAKFRQFGMSDQINAAADHYARATKVIGTSATDMMRNLVEAQGIFRESGALTEDAALRGAKIAAPILAKIHFAQAGLDPESAEKFAAQDRAMLRFIEQRGGANDPGTFARVADTYFKMIQSSGGNINWEQLRAFSSRAGAAGFSLSDTGIAKLEPILTDLTGGTTGSGMRVAFQRLLGIQRGLPKQAVQEYLSLGLWDPTKVELSKTGGIQRFLGRPGDVLRDREKFATDPVAYYLENFLPAIKKKYGDQILGDTTAAKVQRAAEISNVFGPGTAGSLFSQIDKQMPAIQRSIAAQAKALGIDASDKNVAGTIAGKQIMLQRNWQTLMLQLGDHVLPIAIKGMTALNGILSKITAWAEKNPGKLDFIVKSVLAIGAGLIAFGGIALVVAAVAAALAAGPWALATAAITGIVTGVGALIALNWSALSNGFREVYDTLAFMAAHPIKFLTTPIKDLPSAIGASTLQRQMQEGLGHHWKRNAAGQWVQDDAGRPSAAMLKPANQNIVIHNHTYIDGKEVANAAATRINGAVGYQSGSGRYDPTAALPAAALGYNR